MSNWWIECGDSAGLLKLIPDNSVNLIATDPPYYRVKDCDWDKQWKTANEFLGWLRSILAEFQRILKPNGSLYLFTSPQMSARVECLVGELFTVLNRITWRKPPFSTKAEMFTKEDMRKFFPASESIIFAEHFGADNTAKGEVGYTQKCDELRGFVFEPLRLYFDTARKESGLSSAQIQDRMKELTGCRYVFDRHTFSRSQWELPTEKQYKAAQIVFAGYYAGNMRTYAGNMRTYDVRSKSHLMCRTLMFGTSRLCSFTKESTHAKNLSHSWSTSLQPAADPVMLYLILFVEVVRLALLHANLADSLLVLNEMPNGLKSAGLALG